MNIFDPKDSVEIIAGDGVNLRELFNPSKQDLELGYSLAYAFLEVGKKSKLHKLKSSEVYYILKGEGRIYVNGKPEIIKEGQAIYIPADSEQYIENCSDVDLEFLCIVDPAWKKEDEEIIE